MSNLSLPRRLIERAPVSRNAYSQLPPSTKSSSPTQAKWLNNTLPLTLLRFVSTSGSTTTSKHRRHHLPHTPTSPLNAPALFSTLLPFSAFQSQSQFHSPLHTSSSNPQQQQLQGQQVQAANLQDIWGLPPAPPTPYPPEAILPAIYRKHKYRSKYYSQWLKRNDYIPAVIVRGGQNAYRNPIYIAIDKYRWNEQRIRGCLRSRVINMRLPTKHHIEATADQIVYGDRNNGSLLNMSMNDDSDSISIPCIMTTTYEHPVTEGVEHIQFQEFHENERIKISMYVDFDGLDDCIGLKRGGIFQQLAWDIPLWYKGSRENVPLMWHINVQNLQVGTKIKLFRDVAMPENCKLVHPTREYTFCSMVGSSKLKAEEDETAAIAETTAVAPAVAAAGAKAAPSEKKLTNKQEELKMAAAAIAAKQKP